MPGALAKRDPLLKAFRVTVCLSSGDRTASRRLIRGKPVDLHTYYDYNGGASLFRRIVQDQRAWSGNERRTDGNALDDAAGTSDPDGDKLACRWFVCPEAGTCKSSVKIEGSTSQEASLIAPQVEKPEDLHIILEVRDDG